MQGKQDQEVVEALSFLFGGVGASMPKTVTHDLLKQIYRERIFECHPDRAKALGLLEPNLAARTATLNGAYALLNRLITKGEIDTTKLNFKMRQKRPSSPPKKRTAPKRTAGVKPGFSRAPGKITNPRPEEFQYRGVMSPFWEGPLPLRVLRFGRYLYYKGVISWDTLVEGLMWQAQQRPVLGRVLLSKAYISRNELQHILANRERGEFIGTCALRLGFITPKQLEHSIVHQQKQERPLGAYFIRRGLLSHDSLRRYLKRHEAHNHRYDSPTAQVHSLRNRRADPPAIKVVLPS